MQQVSNGTSSNPTASPPQKAGGPTQSPGGTAFSTSPVNAPSGGVIAGAVVGGLAGLALLLLGIAYLWKRRASRKQSAPKGTVRNAFAKPEAQLSLDLKVSIYL